MSYREQSDENEERFQQAIADQLGITAEELDEWVILEEEEFTDEAALVSHFVEFDKNTPPDILAKVGLSQKGTKIKYLEPINTVLPDGNAQRAQDAEGMAPLKEFSTPQHETQTSSKIIKWLLIGLAVALSAGVATVAWIMHSLGPMPSFG
ncbi:hypothetical protein [Pseudomonas viridiflava]|uniref:hypothetical protein n=1 Tax=Pseudomonas viridiflava TaxID=33069 RepID=UPI000F034583|nr:hypothetical protein [Pseudomonas viridiflava]